MTCSLKKKKIHVGGFSSLINWIEIGGIEHHSPQCIICWQIMDNVMDFKENLIDI